jgi:hypothetical protein
MQALAPRLQHHCIFRIDITSLLTVPALLSTGVPSGSAALARVAGIGVKGTGAVPVTVMLISESLHCAPRTPPGSGRRSERRGCQPSVQQCTVAQDLHRRVVRWYPAYQHQQQRPRRASHGDGALAVAVLHEHA